MTKQLIGKLPGVDGNYYTWKNPVHTDDGIRFLKIEGDDIDFSSLLWATYDDAIEAVKSGDWGYSEADAADWVVVEVTHQLLENPFAQLESSLAVSKLEIFDSYVKAAVNEVERLCRVSGIEPKGFYIDNTLCDWREIETESVCSIADEFAGIHGNCGSPNHTICLEAITGAITRFFGDGCNVKIDVSVKRKDSDLHISDSEVAGEYFVCIDGSVPEYLIGNLALDIFHQNVAIKMLEDFDIEPYQNNVLLETNGAHETYDGLKLGKFLDRLA